ncbi:MAG: hypothetical protein ACOZEN_01285 [Thermodesulfobacteriota bacterium]
MKNVLRYLFSFLVMALIGVGIHHLKKGSQLSKEMSAAMVDASASTSRNPGIRAAGKAGAAGAGVSAMEQVNRDAEKREKARQEFELNKLVTRMAFDKKELGKQIQINLAVVEDSNGYLEDPEESNKKPTPRYKFCILGPSERKFILTKDEYITYLRHTEIPTLANYGTATVTITDDLSIFNEGSSGTYALVIEGQGHRWFQ